MNNDIEIEEETTLTLQEWRAQQEVSTLTMEINELVDQDLLAHIIACAILEIVQTHRTEFELMASKISEEYGINFKSEWLDSINHHRNFLLQQGEKE